MSIDIDTYITELRHTVTVAGLNHEIWWVYKSKDTRPQFVDAMNRYSLFFQTSIHAHFVATLVALYRLYETRSDTYNISTLLRSLKEHETIDEEILGGLNKLYQEMKPLWVKVNILRNKAFGHRSTAHTVEEVFKEAAVTPNELRDLVDGTKKLLNKLSHAWDRSSHAFNLGAREDTVRLLDDLNSL